MLQETSNCNSPNRGAQLQVVQGDTSARSGGIWTGILGPPDNCALLVFRRVRIGRYSRNADIGLPEEAGGAQVGVGHANCIADA